MPDLRVRVGPLELKNPVVAGSGEASATADQIRRALEAGAAAVVAKSASESDAARQQLRAAEYVLLNDEFEPRPLGPAARTDSLFCRSGLLDEPWDEWVATLADLDREAQGAGAYVVASLIVSDVEEAVRRARALEEAGVRWLELNVAAPHAAEAAAGAIATGTALVAPIRQSVGIPLTVKVGGPDPVVSAREAFAAGADVVCLTTRAQGFLPDLRTRRAVLGTFGAIGGAWALPLTLRHVAKARAALGADAPLIATNGARDGRDVARCLLAGASAVALTSAVITDGAAVLTRAVDELQEYLDQHDVHAQDLIGEAADSVKTYEEVAMETTA